MVEINIKCQETVHGIIVNHQLSVSKYQITVNKYQLTESKMILNCLSTGRTLSVDYE